MTIRIGTVTLTFLLCWWPYMIMFMYWPYKYDGNKQIQRIIFEIVGNLGYINSFINPVLYISISRDIRRIILSNITCNKVQMSGFGATKFELKTIIVEPKHEI